LDQDRCSDAQSLRETMDAIVVKVEPEVSDP
jgi:hypothetical protein